MIVVVGAAGEAEYAELFQTWATRWQTAAERASANVHRIGSDSPGDTNDRDRLQALLASEATGTTPLWLVLIGHGTFDGKTARFNLRGDDITPVDLRDWLKPLARPVAVINCASSSAPFLAELSGPNRVVVTATRSGHEVNLARLGDFLSQAIGDPQADLDKDEQTSLLEAWLSASARTAEFYTSQTRLQTEHPLLDDNGDKLGTAPDFFQGVRRVKVAKDGAPVDGQLAARFVLIPGSREEVLSPESRARRDEIEKSLAGLRNQRERIGEDEYLQELEPLLIALARLYADGD